MSTSSICTFARSSSDVNFKQIAPLCHHVVGTSSAALADLRRRQAEHVSERGFKARAGQARRAAVAKERAKERAKRRLTSSRQRPFAPKRANPVKPGYRRWRAPEASQSGKILAHV